jgi:hypothetical protein
LSQGLAREQGGAAAVFRPSMNRLKKRACHGRPPPLSYWQKEAGELELGTFNRVDLATSCIGRLPCPHSVEVCSSLSSLLAYRPQRSRNRKATRAAGPRAAWHQQMTLAAGPPMALSQILTPPQPATPTVLRTIAPALLLDQNRPEVRNQLRQRRRRRSSNLVPSFTAQPVQSGASLAYQGFTVTAWSPNFVWGGRERWLSPIANAEQAGGYTRDAHSPS